MIGKLITWGRNREEALDRLDRALTELKIVGVPTTASFHRQLIAHPDFRSGNFDTLWLDKHGEELCSKNTEDHKTTLNKVAAAAIQWSRLSARVHTPPSSNVTGDTPRRSGWPNATSQE